MAIEIGSSGLEPIFARSDKPKTAPSSNRFFVEMLNFLSTDFKNNKTKMEKRNISRLLSISKRREPCIINDERQKIRTANSIEVFDFFKCFSINIIEIIVKMLNVNGTILAVISLMPKSENEPART
jgi:hypothetical protein